MEGYTVAPISLEKHCANLEPTPVTQPEVPSVESEEDAEPEEMLVEPKVVVGVVIPDDDDDDGSDDCDANFDMGAACEDDLECFADDFCQ